MNYIKKCLTFCISIIFITFLSMPVCMAETSEIWEIRTNTPDLRIGVVGDSHVISDTNDEWFESALTAFTQIGKNQLDGLALTGDVIYFNDTTIYDAPYDLIYSHINNIMPDKPVVFAMGNHEFPQNDKSAEISAASIELFEKKTAQTLNYHTTINDFHFITSGAKDYNGTILAENEEWLMQEIDNAIGADSSNSSFVEENGNKNYSFSENVIPDSKKPVFLMLHHPIAKTVFNESNTKYSEEFLSFLKKRPQVINIVAHEHVAAQLPQCIWQDGFTVYQSPLCSNGNVSLFGLSADKRDMNVHTASMIEIENNIVKIFRLDLSTNKYIGEPWEIDIPSIVTSLTDSDNSNDTYYFNYSADKSLNTSTPYYPEGASVSAEVSENTVTLTYSTNAINEATGILQDGFVHGYKIELKAGSTIAYSNTFQSDFYKQQQAATKTQTITGLDYNVEYKATVYPMSPFGVYGEGISTTFTTEKKATSSDVIRVEAENGWTHNGIGVCERLGNADSNVIDSLGLRGNNGKNGSGATYKVNIPTPGKYSIKVFGTSLNKQWTWVVANGVKGNDMGSLVITEGKDFATYGKKTEYLVVDLPLGEIDFTFINGGTYNMFVDYYEFELLEEYYVPQIATLNATESTIENNAVISDDKTHVKISKDGKISWIVDNLPSAGLYNFSAKYYIGNGERFLVYVNDKLVNTTGYFTTYNTWTDSAIAENIALKKGDKISVVIDNLNVALKTLTLTKTGDIVLNATDASLGDNTSISNDYVSIPKNGSVSWTVNNLPSSGLYKFDVNHYIGCGERYLLYINDELVNTTGYFTNTKKWVNETIAENILLKNGDTIKLVIDNVNVSLRTLKLTQTKYVEHNTITLKASKAVLGDNAALTTNKENVSILKNGSVSWTVNNLPASGLYKFDVTHYIGCGERYLIYVNDELVNTTGYFTTTAKWVDETIAENILLKNGDTIKLIIDNVNVTLKKLTLTKTADADEIPVMLQAAEGNIKGNASWSDQTTKSHAILYSGASIEWKVENLISSGAYRFDVTHYIGCGERYLIYVNDELVKTTGYFTTTAKWVEENIADNISLKNGDTIKLVIDNQMVNVRNLKLTKTGEYVAPDEDEETIIDKLAKGNVTIVVDTSETYMDKENVFAAVYYNGILKKAYIGEVNGEESVTLNLDSINASDSSEKEKYTFKLFFWGNDMTPIPENYYPLFEIQ